MMMINITKINNQILSSSPCRLQYISSSSPYRLQQISYSTYINHNHHILHLNRGVWQTFIFNLEFFDD